MTEPIVGTNRSLINFLFGFSIFTIALTKVLSVCFDLPSYVQLVLKFGNLGFVVCVFILGYVLQESYKNHGSLRLLAKSILVNGYLPYIIVVTITGFVALVYFPFIDQLDVSWYAYFGHVLFYKMFDNYILASFGFHMWFISTVVQFCFLFFIVKSLKLNAKGRINSILIMGLAISVLYGFLMVFFSFSQSRIWNVLFLSYLWVFIIGINYDQIRIKVNSIGFNRVVYKMAIVVFCLAMAFLLKRFGGEYGSMVNDIPGVIAYIFIAEMLYHQPIIKKVFGMLAKFSYFVFLIHSLVIWCIIRIMESMDISINYMMALSIVVIIYALSFAMNTIFTNLKNLIFGDFGVWVDK